MSHAARVRHGGAPSDRAFPGFPEVDDGRPHDGPAPASGSHPTRAAADNHMVSPIRWPRLTGAGIGLVAVWAVGLLVGVLVPALVAPPAGDASVGQAVLAFAITLLGVAVMVTAGLLLVRRTGDQGVLLFALLPAAAMLMGGIVLTVTTTTGMLGA